MNLKDFIKEDQDKNYIRVKVLPNSPKNEIIDIMDDNTIKIRINAQASNGKANKELIDFIHKSLEKKYQIEIIAGASDRIKLVKISKK